MTKFKLIEKAADVTKAIDSIGRRAKKLDEDIHKVGLSCMYHADKHGDVTLMQNLITALGRSQRRNALIGWAEAFGKFAPSEDGKSVVYDKAKTTDLAGAEGKSPWDFKPEPAFHAFDFEAELTKLLKRAETAAKDSRNTVPVAKLQAVAKLASAAA